MVKERLIGNRLHGSSGFGGVALLSKWQPHFPSPPISCFGLIASFLICLRVASIRFGNRDLNMYISRFVYTTKVVVVVVVVIHSQYLVVVVKVYVGASPRVHSL